MAGDAWEEQLALSDLAGLPGMSLAELRDRREKCAEMEMGLSYVRRLAQARVDLLVAELERRRHAPGERTSGSVGEVVDQLPHILGDRSRGQWPGRLPTLFAPGEGPEPPLASRVEEVLTPT